MYSINCLHWCVSLYDYAGSAVSYNIASIVSKQLVSMTASDVRILPQEPNPLLTSLSQRFNDSADYIGSYIILLPIVAV